MQYHTAQSLQNPPNNSQQIPPQTATTPQQTQPQAQPTQPEKKSKTGLTIIVSIIVLGLIGGVAYMTYNLGKSEPDDETSVQQQDSGVQVPIAFPYTINDTGQTYCFDDSIGIECPDETGNYYGQDAQYERSPMSFQDNGDGTTTDLNTGLMWTQDPGDKADYDDAIANVKGYDLAGYDDWRVPTIKELYSLINFNGTDPSAETGDDTSSITPFIDTDFFAFYFGDTENGERIIDSQWVTSSIYESDVMNGEECFFGVNFADGRIKCYPTRAGKVYFAIYVRGNSDYGNNDLADNEDGTITDSATGLMWTQDGTGEGVTWQDALLYCEEMDWAGYDDWRLPNAKELQSIVDYSRSPDTTDSPAIDPLFTVAMITNEANQEDYPFYWTGTTHISYPNRGQAGVYISFGRALGYMNGKWMDVHGAGAQRSDPKTGDPEDYPTGHGPQGDARRIYNYARCVRSDDVKIVSGEVPPATQSPTDTQQAPQQDSGEEPPQEAIDACSGKQQDDDCSFQAPSEMITGVCRMIENVLACVP
jgi:hypothetical protein